MAVDAAAPTGQLNSGQFRDSYTSLTADVVIAGARPNQVSATSEGPAAASLSANPHHALVPRSSTRRRLSASAHRPMPHRPCE